MKRSSTQTLHIMYPLKFLCKQYTNQSLSESLLEGISSSCPCCHTALSRLFQVGRTEIQSGETQTGQPPSCSGCYILSLLQPDDEAWLSRRFPRAGLLSLSCVSSCISLPIPFPSRKPLATLHPLPVPHVPSPPCIPSHPMTETNDNMTNPRSTDMFTRLTYALTKSKWARDQGKKAAKCLRRVYATLKMADTGPAAVGFTASAVTLIFSF